MRVFLPVQESEVDRIRPFTLKENQHVLRQFQPSTDVIIIGVNEDGQVTEVRGKDSVFDGRAYSFSLSEGLCGTFRGALSWMVGRGTSDRWGYHVLPLCRVVKSSGSQDSWNATTGSLSLWV